MLHTRNEIRYLVVARLVHVFGFIVRPKLLDRMEDTVIDFEVKDRAHCPLVDEMLKSAFDLGGLVGQWRVIEMVAVREVDPVQLRILVDLEEARFEPFIARLNTVLLNVLRFVAEKLELAHFGVLLELFELHFGGRVNRVEGIRGVRARLSVFVNGVGGGL
jgi:hypothetical protein